MSEFNSQHSHSHSHSYSYSYHHHHEDTNAIILALKQELLLLRADVAVGKQETLTLRAEVASLQTDVNTLKTRVHKLENPGEGLELQEPTVEIELTPMNHSYSQGNIPLSPMGPSVASAATTSEEDTDLSQATAAASAVPTSTAKPQKRPSIHPLEESAEESRS